MPQGTTRRRLVPFIAAGALLAPAANANAITPAECDARANDTPSKLVECIQSDQLWNHMVNFSDIAKANLGPDGKPSRNSGEPGYLASVNYVADLMRQAGYKVTVQPYTFEYFAYQGVPEFTDVTTGHTYTLVDEWNPGQSIGTTTSDVEPAGGIIEPTPDPSSTSGCTAGDFSNFTAGHIALIQRGGCNFGVKVLNAVDAGATGVIIFNEGNPGRTAVISGSLLDENDNPFVPDIPVAFTSFDIGKAL